MDLVTVARFSNSFDLHVIKGKLEHEGIPCYTKDEQTVTIDPLLEVAVGGIKLQVADTDVERANEILKDSYLGNSGSIYTFNLQNKLKGETNALKILLAVIFALLCFLAFV